jgi:preprotein translocase subunit YajC
MLTGVLIVLAVVIFILYMARRNSRKNKARGKQ